MARFGKSSKANLETATPILRRAAYIVLEIKDHSVIKGHRGEEEQNAAFDSGNSELRYPNGKHNKFPSMAIDVQTYPRPERKSDLRDEQMYLMGIYRGVLHMMGHQGRTGADWDNDGEVADNGFDDLFHVEIRDM